MRRTGRAGRVWAASALVALAVGLVAGCDGDPGDPTPTPSSEPPTSETPTEPESTEPTTPAWTPPDIDPPEAPPEMSVDDPTGAAAATYYFLQTYDYMRATGETSRFDAMFTDECTWCEAKSAGVAALIGAGGHIEAEGLTFDITAAEVFLPTADQPGYVVQLDVVEGALTVVTGEGDESTAEPVSIEPMSVRVEFLNDRFFVTGVGVE